MTKYVVVQSTFVDVDGGPVAAAHRALFLTSTGQLAGPEQDAAGWRHPVQMVFAEDGTTTRVDLNEPQPFSADPYEAAAGQREAMVTALTGEERRRIAGWLRRVFNDDGSADVAVIETALENLEENCGDWQPEIDRFFAAVPYGEIPAEVIGTAGCKDACLILLALGQDLTVTAVLGLLARARLLPAPGGTP